MLSLTMKPMLRPLSKHFKITAKLFDGDFTYQELHRSRQKTLGEKLDLLTE